MREMTPVFCRVLQITDETPDVKTFRIQGLDGKKPFAPRPGQLGMLSVAGVGEAMFSITAQGGDWIESSVKLVGELTEAMHTLSVGDLIGVRGPYGNGFPLDALRGRDVLFIGGGIGLAPIRSLIRHCLEQRADYGRLDILYGSRSPADLAFKKDLFVHWPEAENTAVHVTVDRGDEAWEGNVGFVPAYLEELAFEPAGRKVVLCGPPIMIRLCSESLARMGFDKADVITTLEHRMRCGVGKCGRCNIGSKYICKDGPVFTLAELGELPDEI
ncbi:MAG: FAD/NAD(P)-binding protein [Clostridia bacterium]|nr:FAD/NAD(P)-binding protein [Clostridia bacterium]